MIKTVDVTKIGVGGGGSACSGTGGGGNAAGGEIPGICGMIGDGLVTKTVTVNVRDGRGGSVVRRLGGTLARLTVSITDRCTVRVVVGSPVAWGP